MYVNLLIFY